MYSLTSLLFISFHLTHQQAPLCVLGKNDHERSGEKLNDGTRSLIVKQDRAVHSFSLFRQVWRSSGALQWPRHHIYRLLYHAPLGKPVSKNSVGRWGIPPVSHFNFNSLHLVYYAETLQVERILFMLNIIIAEKFLYFVLHCSQKMLMSLNCLFLCLVYYRWVKALSSAHSAQSFH